MTKEEAFNAPKYAGIYLFRNKINGKCYIGQAVKLRKRLLDHWNHYLADRYSHIPLYKAFKKWGMDNFELVILDTIHNALAPDTPGRLDELEKKYIEEYNSYGATGYNATKGGDAGVLGLKQTEETKQHLSKTTKKHFEEVVCANPANWVKAKNLLTGEEVMFISRQRLGDYLGLTSHAIRNAVLKRTKVVKGCWAVAGYLDEYNVDDSIIEAIKQGYDTRFKRKYNLETIKKILIEKPYISYQEFNNIYPMNRNTFMTYRKKLGLVPEQRVDTKVSKEVFTEYYNSHTREECIQHFKMAPRRYYKYVEKYIKTIP